MTDTPCNATITDYSLCTLTTCCLEQGAAFTYLPSYNGNLFFAAFFGGFILPNLYLGLKYRTWSYTTGMIVGLALEVLGYVARIMLHDNPWSDNGFLLYLIAITIAPVFLTAAIYLTLSRIMNTYGSHLSRIPPKFVAIGFMSCDFASLVLQAIGGAIADTADTGSDLQDIGIDVMIAGLILQVVGLTAFLACCIDFFFRCRSGALDTTPAKSATRRRLIFKLTIASLMLSTVVIQIRSIFRVVELWQGFNGELWNDELDFMVLDGAMIGLATVCLTVFHPGFGFGEMWHVASGGSRGEKKESEKGGRVGDGQGGWIPMKDGRF